MARTEQVWLADLACWDVLGKAQDGISATPEPADGGGSGRVPAGATKDGPSGSGTAILLDETLQQSEPRGDSGAQEQELTEERLLERGQTGRAAVPPRAIAPGQGPVPPGGPPSIPAPAPAPPTLPSL